MPHAMTAEGVSSRVLQAPPPSLRPVNAPASVSRVPYRMRNTNPPQALLPFPLHPPLTCAPAVDAVRVNTLRSPTLPTKRPTKRPKGGRAAPAVHVVCVQAPLCPTNKRTRCGPGRGPRACRRRCPCGHSPIPPSAQRSRPPTDTLWPRVGGAPAVDAVCVEEAIVGVHEEHAQALHDA